MSRARDFADLAGSADAGGLTGRNLLINSAMAVAQRGTSVSSDGYGAADRWRLHTSGATVTLSQQSLTVGQTDLPSQFKYYTRLAVTTGNDFTGVSQRIEDVQVVSGQSITVSFYAKGTNPGGGSIRLNMRQNFGSGGSSVVDTDDTFSVTSSWQRFEKTISLPSISGKTIGTASYLQCKFDQGSDTSTNAWTLDITGVQLEVGEQATPFEHRSFADELRRCQRYYWKSVNHDTTPANNIANSNNLHSDGYGSWTAYATTNARTPYFPHPVAMRAAPTVTLYSSERANTAGKTAIFNGTWGAVSSNATQQNENRFAIYCASSGLTANNSYLFAGGWACDSEL